jgi:hypothetical protein
MLTISWRNWLRRLSQTIHNGVPERQRRSGKRWRTRLALERLEERTVPSQFNIVNVIPNSMSGLVDDNAEISVGVNPNNPNQMVTSTFGNSEAYYTSSNGGNTWSFLQNNIVHGDKSITWSNGGTAYTTPLQNVPADRSQGTISVFSSSNPAAGTPFTQIASSVYTTPANTSYPDQPWVRATSVGGVDHIYMAYNDLSLAFTSGNTASVRFSTDGGSTWKNTVLDSGNAAGLQDAPSVRLAVHGNTVYAAFARWTSSNSNSTFPAQIVVVKDIAAGADGFTDLGALGTTVATTTLPFSPNASGGGSPPTLGSERVGSDLAIAVDPNNANHLYVAYVSVDPNTALNLQVHLDESTDGGASFKEVYATSIANQFQAAQPAVAVDAKGDVGLLFNAASVDSSGATHLEVHFVATTNDFATATDSTLLTFKDDGDALRLGDPYLGDFNDLTTVGNTFYGAFTGTNNANGTEGSFPQGVTFQRNFSGTINTSSFKLLDNSNSPIGSSIDPYVFSFSFPADLSVVNTGPAKVLAGGEATYTVTVSNAGPNDAQNVVLTDTLPAGSTLISKNQASGPDAFTDTSTGNTPSFTAATMGAGNTDTFTIVVGIPSNLAAGSTYSTTASVTTTTFDPTTPDTSTTNSTVVVGVNTQTTITSTSVTSPYNSTTAQPVTLTANVTAAGGATVNEGAVTFTINGVSASGAVQNGIATATFKVPPGTLAGNYTITASYADTTGSLFNSSTATNTGTLTITAATTQTALGNLSATYHTGAQLVTLTANVTSPNGGIVNEGNVTFTLLGQTAIGTVTNGTASVLIALPAGLAPGSYPLTASYADTSNVNSVLNYGPSTALPTSFVVNPASTSIAVGKASGSFNSTASQQVTLTATVTSGGAAVTEGNVTFSVAGQTATVAVNFLGQATTTITLPAGFAAAVYPISANYADTTNANGTVNFAPGQGTGTLTVGAAATQTAVTPPNLSVGFNSSTSQQVTLTAGVTSAVGTVNEGKVTFTVGNLSVQGTVVNGTATANLTLPAGFAAGTYTVGASYADTTNNQGAVNFAASTAASAVTLTVGTAGTQVAVGNASATFSGADQSVQLAATVTSPTGGTVSEGTVTFTVGGLTTTGKVSNGVATATLTVPGGFAAGSYAINASYADSTNANKTVNFGPSSSQTPGTLTIGPVVTHLVVSPSTVTVSYTNGGAQQIALQATVTGGGAAITEGKVTFTLGSLPPVTVAVNAQGVASTTLSVPAGTLAGTYPITASYADVTNANGVVNFGPSSGSSSLTVATAATQTVLTSKSANIVFNNAAGQSVTVTATVTSGSGGVVNEGAVTFALGGQTATGTVSNGTATATLNLPAGLAAGGYPITASYADATNANNTVNFGSSTAAVTGVLTINSASTQTTVSSASAPFASSGTQQVALSATVTSANGGTVNEGSVTFTVGTLTPVSVSVNGAGVASTTISLPAGTLAGSYPITASYTDATNLNKTVDFAPSGGANTLAVTPGVTNLVINPSTLTVPYSNASTQLLTLKATVSSGGAAVAEGNVTFNVGSLPPVLATVNSAGIATATVTLPAGLLAGNYPVSASYADVLNSNGLTNFGPTSSSATLTVAAAGSVTSISAISTSFSGGPQVLTLKATLTSPNGGTINEGQVAFSVGGLTATALVLGGSASTTLTLPASFAAGNYVVQANYTDTTNGNGVPNFQSSTGNGSLAVAAVSTQTSVSGATVQFSSGQQGVTLSATVTSSSGPVNEGTVTFTAAGQTLTAAVNGNVATATLVLPGGFAAGSYAINASYADTTNANGVVNLTPSTAAPATLTVVRPTTIHITGLTLSGGFGSRTETVTAQVTAAGGPVNGGTVTFNVGGSAVQASVSNGTAQASVNVPAGTSLGISANFDGGSAFGSSSGGLTAILNFLAELFPATVTFNSDGSEVLTIDFFGIPLVYTYNASGGLESFRI